MTTLAQVQIASPSLRTEYKAGYQVSSRRIAVSDEESKKHAIFETSYEPNLTWWNDNQLNYVQPSYDPLPPGFPSQVDSPSLWDGQELINQPERWLHYFTPDDIQQLEEAYAHFASLSLTNNDITQESFPIPTNTALYHLLAETASEVKNGLGVQVLRGLPVDDWDRSKQLVIFAGISAYIGKHRIAKGSNWITHLRDITNLPEDKRPPITVKGQTSGNQVFHNDGGAGIVSLITLGVAETGGLSQLSSVAQTYNHLVQHRRDVIRELAKPNWVNKAFPQGKALIHAVDNHNVISLYSRRPFFGFYESNAEVPPLAEEKHLALDALHFTAERFRLDIDLQKGDLEYFNNLTVYHARTSSVDSENNQRHLVRLWLSNEEQTLPLELQEQFKQAVKKSESAHGWPLEAWDED